MDGQQLAQSHAISRYLARQNGMAGKDDWEQALADMYVEHVKDMMIGMNIQLFYYIITFFLPSV